MSKIAFVSPWYGDNIPGGAETALRGIIMHLQKFGAEVEVLTTCVEKFASDWNVNFYREGDDIVAGIPVKRFKVRERDTKAFDQVNAKLIYGKPITKREEEIFMREMVNSPALYRYISEHKDEYQAFVYIPYMFGTTYYGILACPEKAVVIPCFHEEAYIHMEIYKKAFEHVKGIIYLSDPEKETANKVFDLSRVPQVVIGTGIDTDIKYDPLAFREKFNISEPFILYAGRKDTGKNVDMLLKYFDEYKMKNADSDLKLVLLGGGDIEIPDSVKEDVCDLGFVDLQDKYNAYAAAELLCQPSTHESFSIVIMESWLCQRPVLVHSGCDVTREFAKNAEGGLSFGSYEEFEKGVNYIVAHKEEASLMGERGKKFVLENYDWSVVTLKIREFIESDGWDKEFDANKLDQYIDEALKHYAVKYNDYQGNAVKAFVKKFLGLFTRPAVRPVVDKQIECNKATLYSIKQIALSMTQRAGVNDKKEIEHALSVHERTLKQLKQKVNDD